MRGSINNRSTKAHTVEQTPRIHALQTVKSEGTRKYGASPTSILDGPGSASPDASNTSTQSGCMSSSSGELYSSESENESVDSDCDSSESSDTDEEDCKPVKKQKTTYVQKNASKNMNPGRRIIGGRIYDSVLGETCHWCRQKTVEDHVACCKCPVKFCGLCLRNRHGEDIDEERKEGVKWVCPKCRGGCGPACSNCCNCGPCRKAQGLQPTGHLVREARASGFSNVHDFLISQCTGECEKTISLRKMGHSWTHGSGNKIRQCDDEPMPSVSNTKIFASCNIQIQPHSQMKASTPRMRGAIVNPSQRRSIVDSSAVCTPATPPPSPASHHNPQIELAENKMKGALSRNFSFPVDNVSPELEVIQEKTSADVYIESSVEVSGSRPPLGNPCKIVRSLFSTPNDVVKTSGPDDSTLLIRSFNPSNGGIQVKLEPSIADAISCINKSDTVNNFPSTGTQLDECGKTQNMNASLHDKLEKSIVQVKPEPSIADAVSCINKSDRVNNFPSMGTQCDDCGKAQNLNASLDDKSAKSIVHGSKEPENFAEKLQSVLDEPFDMQQLEEMWALASHRKPVLRYRETRHGSHEVPTSEEGFSYLDRQPDLALRLASSVDPEGKLRLLRGFFCWLQCACMPGAYVPWADSRPAFEDEDCVETDGPDCEITAVVLSVDEGETLQSVLHHSSSATPSDGKISCENFTSSATKNSNVSTDIVCNRQPEFGTEEDVKP